MMRKIKTNKTEVTIYYDETSPLQDDRLMIDKSSWLEPDDFKVISDDPDKGELTVEVQIPTQPCRFLGVSDGSPDACFGFGNPATNGKPWYMEGENISDSDIVCLHCRLYSDGPEKRRHPQAARTTDQHGYIWLLPELSRQELGAHADSVSHVDRKTGEARK